MSCILCSSNVASIYFTQCKHLNTCYDCIQDMKSKGLDKNCPSCRANSNYESLYVSGDINFNNSKNEADLLLEIHNLEKNKLKNLENTYTIELNKIKQEHENITNEIENIRNSNNTKILLLKQLKNLKQDIIQKLKEETEDNDKIIIKKTLKNKEIKKKSISFSELYPLN